MEKKNRAVRGIHKSPVFLFVAAFLLHHVVLYSLAHFRAPNATPTRHGRRLFTRSCAADNIPPLLGSLISLTQLSLGHNKLSGPLPDSLGNLIHLKYFSAEHNRLSGPVPSFVCHMTALENFNISNNELRGAIPDKIGALVRLRKLDFAHNQFSGDIPASLGNLSALNWLFLDHNQLTGPVPANFGNLKELLILNLSFNRLSGPLPAALPLLINLTSASLQGNLFVGPFHFPATFQFWFSRVSGMAALDFGSNEIEEPFPDMHGMHELRILLLNNNRIYDRLAEGLAEACPNLFKLCLHNNRLSGEVGIPSFFLFLVTHGASIDRRCSVATVSQASWSMRVEWFWQSYPEEIDNGSLLSRSSS